MIKRIFSFSISAALILMSLAGFTSCAQAINQRNSMRSGINREALADTIKKISEEYPGEIGTAIIVNGTDTIAVNDTCKYPMMSVFKLHQAIALCHYLEKEGITTDTILSIRRSELDPDTWSPMLKDYADEKFSLPVSELMRYTLIQSDNNASNLMFKRLAGIEYTDSLISTLIPRNTFSIKYSEDEMKAEHQKAYSNCTSPLGAASLINRLFTDSIIGSSNQEFIKTALTECETGKDRIVAPLLNIEGVKVSHKTGSGYRTPDGRLAAHNDVAYIVLPDGTHYSLAIFVKDFDGDESAAAGAIARISAAVYSYINEQ